jgi:hypothetical protein
MPDRREDQRAGRAEQGTWLWKTTCAARGLEVGGLPDLGYERALRTWAHRSEEMGHPVGGQTRQARVAGPAAVLVAGGVGACMLASGPTLDLR